LIVDSEKSAAEAIVTRLPGMSREAIRSRFEQRFTARRMANDYVEAYRQLIADTKGRRPVPVAVPKLSPPAKDRPKDHRHQNGTDAGLYVGD
jgi:hypothetical protein